MSFLNDLAPHDEWGNSTTFQNVVGNLLSGVS